MSAPGCTATLLLLALFAQPARAQRRPPPPAREGPPIITQSPSEIDADAAAARAAVAEFVSAEARGGAGADTLLALGADFIVTGIKAQARPRLAGLNGPGETTIEESECSLAGAFAWVVISYRFAGRTTDLDERARATFVLEKQRAGWRIRHVHSSMVERW
ncbi:MAG: nuclear transport factor 2 family protein [Gemmatimonadales bacterium]